MRLAAALFSTLLAPALGLAQTVAPAPASAPMVIPAANAPITRTQDSAPLLPLWGTPDGRILALIALDANRGAPVLPQAPQIGSAADWQLIDVTNFVGGNLSWRLTDRVNAYARFGRGIVLAPLNSAALSLGCDANLNPIPNALCTQRLPFANSGSVRVGTSLSTDHLDIGVDYGSAWLQHNAAPLASIVPTMPLDLFTGIGGQALPALALPALQLADIRDTGIGAQSRWRWDDNQSLDLAAALSRVQIELPGGILVPALNQAALSFGVHKGNFSGTLTGRVLGPANPLGANGQNWTSIDLGISWRAPWRGVFSIGAQNLWSSGNPPPLADPVHETDSGQSRVPYVQYHQDL